MAKRTPYSTLVAEAERAVASVVDPALKRAAFERVLNHLLQADDAPRPSREKAKKTSSKTPAGGRAGKGGPRPYTQELVDEGFFKKPKTIAEVRAELRNRGHHLPLTSLSGPLQILCQRR